MLGWMILFALMAVTGAVRSVTGDQIGASAEMAGLLFFVLFVLGLLTRVARGGAR